MTTTVQVTIVPGSRTGKSGKVYVFGQAEGVCDRCSTPFGVVAAFGRDDVYPRKPRVSFVHDADGPPPVHHLEMTGNSDAARALRGEVVAAMTERVPDDRRN